MTKQIREEITALQQQLAEGQTVAAREFRKLIESKAVKKVVADVAELRDRMVPGSPEEQQLDAYVSVHNSILQYLSQQYPDQIEGEVTPQPAGPAA